MKNNFNTNLITENRSEAMQIAKVIFGNKNVNLYTAGELIHISIDGEQIASIDTASGKLIVNQFDLFSGKVNATEYLSELEKLRLALSRKNIVRYKQVSTAQVGLFGLSDSVLTQESLIKEFQAILKKLDLGNLTAFQKEEIVQIGFLLEIDIDFDVISNMQQEENKEVAKAKAAFYSEEPKAPVGDSKWCKFDKFDLTVNDFKELLDKTKDSSYDPYDRRKIKLLVYKYLLLNDKQHAHYKGFYKGGFDETANSYILKNKNWIKEIDERIKDYISTCNITLNNVSIFNTPEIYKMPKEGSLLLLNKTEVDTIQNRIPALYAIIELDKLVPSNDGITFNKNKNYPQECQSRDYSTKTEQAKVLENAKNFDATFLISDIKTPADGAPIIDRNGIVYGGNSRTMVLQRVAKFSNFNEMYVKELIQKAFMFGLNPADLKKFKFPVLVKVIDKPNNCGALSQELQRNRTAEQDEITLAIALSKQVNTATIENIAAIMDNYDFESFSQFFDNRAASNSVINALRKDNIITATNQAKWINTETSEFSKTGQELFKFMLLAKLFPNKQLLENSGSFSNVIAPNIVILTKINTLPRDWNIVQNISDAIQKNLQARAAKMNFNEFVSQNSAFDTANDVSENTKIIWKAMLHSKPRVFGTALKSYYESAKNALNEDAMFKSGDTSTDVLRALFTKAGLNDREFLGDSADYSNLMDEVIPTKWDMQFSDNDYSEDEFQNSLQLPKLPTLEDAKRKRWTQKRVPLRRTAELLPGLLDNAKILVFGRQGSGKSTFVLQLMDDLGKSGKVLFVSAEEKASARLQERLIRNRIAGRNIEILNTNDWAVIKDFADRGDYKYIVVDSHNSVIGTTQKGILSFVATHPDTFMVFISRMSKNGKDVLGSSDWGYDVDTEIFLNEGVAKTLKHRDGISGREMRVMSKDYSTLTSL